MNTDTRTDDELNKVIAEWCGWRFLPSQDIYIAGIDQALPEHWEDPDEAAHEQCPNYCQDLNAVHEAIAKLGYIDGMRFIESLAEISDNNEDYYEGWCTSTIVGLFDTTARQRAEALVKVIESTNTVK